jgi:hypothetical protein
VIVQACDTLSDNWGKLRTRLPPWLDRAIAGLTDDLDSVGMSERTLVVLGEFSRTPNISTLPGEKLSGRDRWASV